MKWRIAQLFSIVLAVSSLCCAGGSKGQKGVGDYMDSQAKEMQDDLANAKVERVGDGIRITFGSGILFDVDRFDLRPEAQAEIGHLADILNRYPDTYVRIEGHTDADGTESHNQTLSERRAAAVADLMSERGVATERMKNFGFGETRPVASNQTADGKQANRRVEVIIEPNEALLRMVEKKAGPQG